MTDAAVTQFFRPMLAGSNHAERTSLACKTVLVEVVTDAQLV